ncbi:MAG: hypothetical protein GY844_12705 [Bradyrhizobium sp.]|nr:hypothetical protein [Bradyrhizobium sp.]
MRKSLLALAAIAALAGSVVASTGSAQAQRYYAPGYYYGPGYFYPPQSYYYNGAPAYSTDPTGPCYWQRQRFWDGFAWRVRNVRVCG